jgi:hypothetical protein
LWIKSGVEPVRADQATATVTPDATSVVDQIYVGIRAGEMPVRLTAGKLDAGLADLGLAA